MAIQNLLIGDIGTFANNQINQCITKLELSWTLDLVSEISFDVVDKDMFLYNRNSFLIRRDVVYNNDIFEMSNISLRQDAGSSTMISVKARKKVLQLMKRDKNPEAYGGTSGTEFAALVAERYKLKFVGEPTAKAKVIGKSAGSSTDDSVYDVLKRSAGEANFVVFESDGTLYFASEQWLLNKWANVAIDWPNYPSTSAFYTFGMPECSKSDDDPYAAEFKMLVNNQNGKQLRPGMTAVLNGINAFNGSYLITEVSYEEGRKSPVAVSCRTPVKPKEEKKTDG
jgi:hypothetical protein